jgi:hypothetical protein
MATHRCVLNLSMFAGYFACAPFDIVTFWWYVTLRLAQFCWFWPNSLGHNLMSLGCALISLFYAGHENHNFDD